MSNHQMTEELRIMNDQIFGGTTCVRHTWLEDVPGTSFVIAHHGSHASYVNRFRGSLTCKSYHVPLRKVYSNQSYENHLDFPMCVEGRLSKEKKAEIVAWCQKQPKETSK